VITQLHPALNSTQRRRLFQTYVEANRTDEEAMYAAGVPERSCFWKRCGELRDAGLITWTNQYRESTIGGTQRECRLTADGRAQAVALGLMSKDEL
jgi:hypothetical protein